MRGLIFLLFAVTLTSGCSFNPWTTINNGMQHMAGLPIDALFAKLGYPTIEGDIAGEHYYEWSNGGSVYIPDVSTTNGYGTVGAQPFNYSQTTFGGGTVGQIHCQIRVFVDKDKLITHYDGNGNNGACMQFAQSLAQVAAEPVFAAKFPDAKKKALAAMTECKKKRLNGEFKTHVQSVECANPMVLKAYQEAGYPYMDLIEQMAQNRLEAARRCDTGEFNRAQEITSLHDFTATMAEQEKEREKGN